MPSVESDDTEWVELFTGPNASVWVHNKCKKELEDLNTNDRAKIEACMKKMYCTMERPEDIPPSKLNPNEGRHSDGKREYRLQAFKSFQGRVYGAQGSINGKRTFFAACAAVKKRDRADTNEFERAVGRLRGAVETVPGAVLGAGK